MPARSRFGKTLLMALLIIAIVALLGWGLVTLIGNLYSSSQKPAEHIDAPQLEESVDENGVVHGTTPEGVTYLAYGRDRSAASSDRITFAAVGDIIGSQWALDLADARAGAMGDESYDFKTFFKDVSLFLRDYDLQFVNLENVVDPSRPIEAYPSFNSPESLVDALADAPFNIVNFNSNHSWDYGAEGIENTRKVLAKHPEFVMVGSYQSQADRNAIRVVERNGAKIAFLSYSYGYNGYDDLAQLPNSYYAAPFNKTTMQSEIAHAKSVADAVVVYVHWGTEYQMDIDEQQKEYAQFLADQGVDLVIGSHAHIMQPINYVKASDGTSVPVAYGLSDFVSGWTLTKSIISGIFTCDFVWNGDKLTVDNLQYYPAIEWQGTENGPVSVCLLKDLTNTEIAKNLRTEDVDDDLKYLRTYINDLGMEVPVVWDGLTNTADDPKPSSSAAASSAATASSDSGSAAAASSSSTSAASSSAA